jgi:hypothetical protein
MLCPCPAGLQDSLNEKQRLSWQDVNNSLIFKTDEKTLNFG